MDDIPMIAAPVGKEESAVKKVVVDLGATKGPEAPRKRKVRLNPEAKTNEALPEGKA
jgi:hypothetical protein